MTANIRSEPHAAERVVRGFLRRGVSFFVRGLCIIGLGVALTALSLEIWARLQPRGFFLEYDELLGFRLEPGAVGEYRGWMLSPNPAIRTPVHINALGIRGPERSLEKPAGTRRLVVVGDSYVQALEVPYEETFYARLEARVREAGETRLEAIPMGVSGYGQAQQLLWLKRLGLCLSPDLVIASVFLGNDVTDNSSEIGPAATRPYFELRNGKIELVSLPREAARWKYAAAKYLRSFIIYKEIGHRVSALERLGGNLGVVSYVYAEEGAGEALARSRRDAWALTLALVEEIARLSRSAGAQVLLAYHGSYPTGSAESAAERFSRFCAEAQLDCLDLASDLEGHAEYFVPIDEHWTARGHERVAELIWDYWQDTLVGKTSRPSSEHRSPWASHPGE